MDLGISGHHGVWMVRRAVIDHNDLGGRDGLTDNATDRIVKECGMIIGGDDYRDRGFGIRSCTGQSRIHLKLKAAGGRVFQSR